MSHSLELNTVIDSELLPIDYNIGIPTYKSNMASFMQQNISETIEENIDNVEIVLVSLNNNLPDNIKNFYRKIKSSTQEIYIKQWTMFSLDNIFYLSEQHNTDNIHVTDIGLKYIGMGHCIIAFYEPNTDLIYYRYDGGSNGWDREERYNALKKYTSNDTNPGITLDTFLKQINEELDEDDCLF